MSALPHHVLNSIRSGIFGLAAWIFTSAVVNALPAKVGDLDEDGVPTVLDLAKLTAHFSGTHPLPAQTALFADLNKDGVLNNLDQEELVKEILGTRTPEDLPLASIRETSPSRGEANVAVTRETIIHFTQPLSPFTSIDTTRFRAEFGGRKILSFVEIGSDRKKVTLFYHEPLPANARVNITFNGNGLNDLIGRPMDADGDGLPGGIYTTDFQTISNTPVANTAVVGRVFASERGTGGADVPLAGVTITVDGAEETLRCVTDAQGNFTLSPSPSGLFFVHIDGRTSPLSQFPNGDYYPTVGKKWFAQPGRLDNPAGDIDDTPQGGGTGIIYLPQVCAGTLEVASPTQVTSVTFPPEVLAMRPELASVELRIPPNSLFADDGSRGGRVGIAPVAPDRIPSPLPPGLNPTFVFTVQSDGPTNFDQPVPVSLPNLPDPATGKKLEPGAKSAFFMFNHDLGEWVLEGSMTVTEDGQALVTDAGVGVRQPGWALTSPATEVEVGPYFYEYYKYGYLESEDPDSDSDSVPDSRDSFPSDSSESSDSDKDGIGDNSDQDDNNNEIPDNEESNSNGELDGDSGPGENSSSEDGTPDKNDEDSGPDEETSTPNVMIRVRSFIPSPAITLAGDFFGIPTAEPLLAATFSGDNRGPSNLPLALSRSNQAVVVNPSKDAPQIVPGFSFSNETRRFGSIYSDKIDVFSIRGKPTWWLGVSPSPTVTCRSVATHSVKSSPVWVHRLSKGVTEVRMSMSIQDPCVKNVPDLFVPNLDYSFTLILTANSDGSVGYTGSFSHDGFPAYEIFINDDLVYYFDPVSKQQSPFSLMPPMEWNRRLSGKVSNQLLSSRHLKQNNIVSGENLLARSLVEGRFYYIIEDMESGIVVLRGSTGAGNQSKFILAQGGGRYVAKLYFPESGKSSVFPFEIQAGRRKKLGGMSRGEFGDRTDSDADGLTDWAELICGTDPILSDSNGDGISDLRELLSFTVGSTPMTSLSASPSVTNVASSISDISSSPSALAISSGSEGTAFLRPQGVAAPILRTRMPTSAQAVAVSMGAGSALIAESDAGFRCVALDDQLSVSAGSFTQTTGRANSVVASGSIGYGGTSNGEILEFDLSSGAALRRLSTGAGEIEDLAIQGDWLLARKPDRLLAIRLTGEEMVPAGELILPPTRFWGSYRLRIALAENSVFCTKENGLHIVDTSNLPNLTLKGTVVGPGDNWSHFVPNGRIGLLAGKVQTTNNPFLRLPVPASLFQISEAGDTVTYATNYDMPGFARCVAINRGVGYVGCDNGMLAVVNYLDFDRNRVAPAISLESNVNLASATPGTTEGSMMRLTASVTDDVQVGNVEFHIDGKLAFDDGSYPFEHRFLAPRRSATKTSFTVRARAFDTGGNSTWSTEYTVNLLADSSPPMVRNVVPTANTMNLAVRNVHVRFNKWMDDFTLTPPGLSLLEAGSDGAFGTIDDVNVPYFLVYRDSDSLARLALAQNLPRGLYRINVATSVTDATGNPFAAPVTSDFRVYSLVDSDGDGLPDDWEVLLGTDPALADSNSNGIPDGMEDRDNDGTPDGAEVVQLGQDPRIADANGNGILDGLDDSDSDGFLDRDEALAGTSIHDSDTDDDGLDDGTEHLSGLNPLVSNNSPTLVVSSTPTAIMNVAREETPVIPTPVRSAPAAVLNAVPEVTPVIPTPVQSSPTSYLNQLPTPP